MQYYYTKKIHYFKLNKTLLYKNILNNGTSFLLNGWSGGRYINGMRKVMLILLLIALCSGVGKGLYWAKKGFSLRRIAGPVKVELIRWSDEANGALDQPFRFLGRGRQCFAFESLDGKYVLKFPRTDIYQKPFREIVSKANERDKREKFVLESMRIAFDELKEETGSLGIHFGQTADLGEELHLIDSLGFSYRIPRQRASFVLQMKQPILMKCFLEATTPQEKEKILGSLIDFVVVRGKKGIWNKDESFLRNYGFDGERGYQIDIGSFYHRPDAVASIRDTLHPVRSWLMKKDPEIVPYFDTTLELKLSLELGRNEK